MGPSALDKYSQTSLISSLVSVPAIPCPLRFNFAISLIASNISQKENYSLGILPGRCLSVNKIRTHLGPAVEKPARRCLSLYTRLRNFIGIYNFATYFLLKILIRNANFIYIFLFEIFYFILLYLTYVQYVFLIFLRVINAFTFN